jgi:hypothetical protein
MDRVLKQMFTNAFSSHSRLGTLIGLRILIRLTGLNLYKIISNSEQCFSFPATVELHIQPVLMITSLIIECVILLVLRASEFTSSGNVMYISYHESN